MFIDGDQDIEMPSENTDGGPEVGDFSPDAPAAGEAGLGEGSEESDM